MVEIARQIGYPAGGEGERGRLSVQVGEFGLELHDRVVSAGNVARAAGAGAVGARRCNRRLDHGGMEAHAEIVVGAPYGNVARTVLFALGAPQRHREPCGVALEIGEGPVALFRLQKGDRVREAPLVVHRQPFLPDSRPDPASVLFTHFGTDPARPCPVGGSLAPPRRIGAAEPAAGRAGQGQAECSTKSLKTLRRGAKTAPIIPLCF